MAMIVRAEVKLAEQQRKIKYLIIKGYKNTLIFETHLFVFLYKTKKERELKQRKLIHIG